MADLNLDMDEGILITTNEVECTGNDSRESILEMHLTNKNIIYVTSHREKTGGVFSKSVTIEDVQKVPLSSIKVIDGRVMVTQEKVDFFDFELQIQFIHGVERYSFFDESKKISAQWVNEINRLFGKEPPYQEEISQEKESQNNSDFMGLSGIASTFKEMAGNIKQSMSSAAKQASDSVKEMNAESHAKKQAEKEAKAERQAEKEAQKRVFQAPPQPQSSQQPSEGGFCTNCGTQLPPGTRFCPRCGTPVNGSAGQTPPPIPQMQSAQGYPQAQSLQRNPQMQPAQGYPQAQPIQPYPQMQQTQGYPQMQPNQGYPQMQSPQGYPQMQPIQTNIYGNSETRRQEFAGKVVKCPNCGELIGYEYVVCPSCGMEISGRSGSSSVQRLQKQLLAIEDSRIQRTALGNLMTKNMDDTTIINKKVTLITNFPIPNTIEEISEFVILAAGNIDVRLSRASLGSKIGFTGGVIGLSAKMMVLPAKMMIGSIKNNSDAKETDSSISDAWVVKLQQAYQKAKLLFSDRPIFQKIQQIYTDKMKELNMKAKK